MSGINVDERSITRSLVRARAVFQPREPYILSGKPWPTAASMARIATALVDRTFAGAVPGREKPRAVVTIGVMGSGKSTAVKKIARGWRPAVIDVDAVTYEFLGGGKLPDSGSLYDLSDAWTTHVFARAVREGYNIVYDSVLPTVSILQSLKKAGYCIEMMLVCATQPQARRRQVKRDLARGWGRPGRSESSHIRIQRTISNTGPSLARRYADFLTVCDNRGPTMRCTELGAPLGMATQRLARIFKGCDAKSSAAAAT